MIKVYKLSEDQLSSAAIRIIKAAVKLMVIVLVLVNGYFLGCLHLSWKYALIGSAVCVPAFGLAILIGYGLLKQSYKHYRIVLDDDGVEFYMPPNDKKIKWENLSKHLISNGTIELHDTTKSAFFRWLTGEGNIQIIPELENFDDLCTTIDIYINKFSV
ncbi:hypothetical protein MUGA111182_06390 [Mucilaginibacter galii]|uniref:YcxB family protein n=1 Tax=Mucilaginibacter galii TaxID=2005073 RepID=A0A917JAN0_9SPHI|nr:hypothetical protein [Mucilaginibacter galii]GGI51721.1 hypothetical protein GCM10011425_29330 [Mucilaginibacter galii]